MESFLTKLKPSAEGWKRAEERKKTSSTHSTRGDERLKRILEEYFHTTAIVV
jgi:hypothetical protein